MDVIRDVTSLYFCNRIFEYLKSHIQIRYMGKTALCMNIRLFVTSLDLLTFKHTYDVTSINGDAQVIP